MGRLGVSVLASELVPTVRVLLHACTDCSASQRMVRNWRFSESELEQLAIWSDGIKSGKPIQHVLGMAWFMGLELHVDFRVLVPRPETEELVGLLLHAMEGKGPQRVLDIGTGSGCIALAWKSRRPEDAVFACDVSREALEVAKRNGRLLGLEVNWALHDVLSDVGMVAEWDGGFDVLISNPPYIQRFEAAEMEARVLEHEPATALFVPDGDPLLFYRNIGICAIEKGWMRPGGVLGFECHRDHAHTVAEWLDSAGHWSAAQVVNDMQGVPRIVWAIRN